MYGLVEQEVSRHRRVDIRRELAAYRLESKLRSGRVREYRSREELGRRLARYAGLLGKRLRHPDNYQAARDGGDPIS